MADVARHTVHLDGQKYAAGSKIEVKSKKQRDRLLRLGAIAQVKEEKEEKEPEAKK